MGGIITFIVGLIVIVIICRALSAIFPAIKDILQVIAFILGIVIWICDTFWLGLLAWLASAALFAIAFGSPDETNPDNLMRKDNRPAGGLQCKNCKSHNTYKLDSDAQTEFAQELMKRDIDFGRIYDSYKCKDCGNYMWYEDNGLRWTYDEK